MIRWECEGNGNKKVIPAHLYSILRIGNRRESWSTAQHSHVNCIYARVYYVSRIHHIMSIGQNATEILLRSKWLLWFCKFASDQRRDCEHAALAVIKDRPNRYSQYCRSVRNRRTKYFVFSFISIHASIQYHRIGYSSWIR